MRYSFGFQEVLEALRLEYLGVAGEILQASGKRITVSRLSVSTGLTRREVTRLYRDASVKEGGMNVGTRVLGQWERDARFCTKTGKPRLLTLRGSQSEFNSLVASVTTDINPAAVLAELERIQAVERVGDSVKFISGYHSLRTLPLEGAKLLANDLDTLVAAVEENISGTPEVRNLHMRTEYDNIFLADLPQLKKKLLEIGARLHREVRMLLAEHDKDFQPHRDDPAGGRVALGTFSWTDAKVKQK